MGSTGGLVGSGSLLEKVHSMWNKREKAKNTNFLASTSVLA